MLYIIRKGFYLLNEVEINNNHLITSWNVNGLEYKSHGIKCNKLGDPEVINFLKTSDCIGSIETHAEKKC